MIIKGGIMIKKVLKNQKVLLVLFSIFFIGISFLYFSNKIEINDVKYNIKKYQLSNDEKKKIKIEKNLEEIALAVDTKKNEQFSPINYNFYILDCTGETIYHTSISFKEFFYKGYYIINLKKLNLKEGSYSFYITNDKSNYSDTDEWNYNLKLKYKNNYIFTIFLVSYLFISIIFLLILLLGIKNQDKLHILFLKMAFPIMLLYVFIIPIYTGTDEKFQWIKAYEISEFKVIPDVEYGWSGAYLPKNILLDLAYDGNLTYKDIIENIHYTIDDNDKLFISGGSMDIYSPIQYIPQVIGIKLCKLISKNTIFIIYSARLLNMITGVLLISLSIKLIPKGKKILFFLGFNPVFIQCFTTLSGDQITISLSFLLISYLLKLKTDNKKIQTKDVVVLSILSSLLSLCKLVYILLPFLIFMLPKDKFKDKKQFILCVIFVLLVPILLNISWLCIISGISDGASPFAVPSKNLKLFLSNPMSFIQYFVYSIEAKGSKLLLEIFNNDILMMSSVINNTLVPILTIGMTYYLLTENSHRVIKFNKFNKLLILAIVSILIILIHLSDYIFWDNHNTKVIYGVYGRYFIPILPLVYLIINNKFGKIERKNSRFVLIIGCLVINFMTLMEIFTRFL